jgi:hypothetical protein
VVPILEINWRLHISVVNAKRNDLWVAGNEIGDQLHDEISSDNRNIIRVDGLG